MEMRRTTMGRWLPCFDGAMLPNCFGVCGGQCFLLPSEYREFEDIFNSESHAKTVWIWRPCAAARGSGIRLITKLSQATRFCAPCHAMCKCVYKLQTPPQ